LAYSSRRRSAPGAGNYRRAWEFASAWAMESVLVWELALALASVLVLALDSDSVSIHGA
jgi:hypothetical protein